jgi:hypothetical protein
LVGAIPSGLFFMKNLSYVYLYHNRLSREISRLAGTLPPELTHTASDILAALHSTVFDDDGTERRRKETEGCGKKRKEREIEKEKGGERKYNCLKSRKRE